MIAFIPSDDLYAKELLSADWEALTARFGVQAPAALVSLFEDPNRILRHSFKVEIPMELDGEYVLEVDTFEPITEKSLEPFEGVEQFMSLASDGGEGLYMLDPSNEDPELHHFNLDTYDLTSVGLSLSEFISARWMAIEDLL